QAASAGKQLFAAKIIFKIFWGYRYRTGVSTTIAKTLSMGSMDRAWILLAKKKAGEASVEEEEELGRLMEQGELQGPASEVMDRVWEAPLVVNPELRPGARGGERWEGQSGVAGGGGRVVSFGRWAAAACAAAVVVGGVFLFGGRKKVVAVVAA